MSGHERNLAAAVLQDHWIAREDFQTPRLPGMPLPLRWRPPAPAPLWQAPTWALLPIYQLHGDQQAEAGQ